MSDGATMVFTGTADQLFAMADAAMDKVRQFHDQAAGIPPVEFKSQWTEEGGVFREVDAAQARALARTAELERIGAENTARWDSFFRGETQAAAGADTLAESTGRARGSMRSMMLMSHLLLSPLGMNTEAFRALHIAMIAMNTGGQGITSMFASLKAGATAALTAIAGLSAPALIAIGAIAAAAAVITVVWSSAKREIREANEELARTQKQIDAMKGIPEVIRSQYEGAVPTSERQKAEEDRLASLKKAQTDLLKDTVNADKTTTEGLESLQARRLKMAQDLENYKLKGRGLDKEAVVKQSEEELAAFDAGISSKQRDADRLARQIEVSENKIAVAVATAAIAQKYETTISEREAAMTAEQRKSADWLKEKGRLHQGLLDAVVKEGEATVTQTKNGIQSLVPLKDTYDYKKYLVAVTREQTDLQDELTGTQKQQLDLTDKQTKEETDLADKRREAADQLADKANEAEADQDEFARRRREADRQYYADLKEASKGGEPDTAVFDNLVRIRAAANSKIDADEREARKREGQKELAELLAFMDKRENLITSMDNEIADARASAEERQVNEIDRKYEERMGKLEVGDPARKKAMEARIAGREAVAEDLEQRIKKAEDKPLRFVGLQEAWKEIAQTANTINIEREQLELLKAVRDQLIDANKKLADVGKVT